MKATLKIDVEYSGPDANKKVIRSLLDSIVFNAASQGQLSGEWDLEVVTHNHTISFPTPARHLVIRRGL